MHIKLHTTDLYLAVISSNTDPKHNIPDTDLEIALVNARWRSTPQATWYIDPVEKDVDHVTFGSYIKLISASKMFLHVFTEGAPYTMNKPLPVRDVAIHTLRTLC